MYGVKLKAQSQKQKALVDNLKMKRKALDSVPSALRFLLSA